MRYLRHAFAPGWATKSWCVLLRKGSPTRTETLSREWWPMNDESLIRLQPRKSKHGSVSEPCPYQQFRLRCGTLLQREGKEMRQVRPVFLTIHHVELPRALRRTALARTRDFLALVWNRS